VAAAVDRPEGASLCLFLQGTPLSSNMNEGTVSTNDELSHVQQYRTCCAGGVAYAAGGG
jgi:hypothetical protein